MRIQVNQVPPYQLSPNWRGHWAQRYRASGEYQAAVFYECVNARNMAMRNPGGWVPFKRAILDLTFVFAYYQDRDEDNMRARFKPGQDAIVQAGFIPDDKPAHLILGKLDMVVDRGSAPLTIIELREANVE